jgi:outer membrane protein assembly factor BamE (lipoprotein component of BamABCDE complex)
MTLRPFALALLAALPASCVVVHSDSHSTSSGREVSEATLAQIKPGTTQEYVLALLGEPSSRSGLGDGSAIWKWSHTRRETSSGSFILLFSGDRTVEIEGACYVEFAPDGLVRHTWRD